MRVSVFSAIRRYFGEIFWGVRSTCRSFLAGTPYLLSVGDLRKEVTEQYPDPISSKTADDLPARSRGLLYNDIERCTGCAECEKICPTDSISLKAETRSESGKIWVSVFDIDFARCVFCGLCVDVCAPQSLVHTRHYERAVYDLPDLLASFGRGPAAPSQPRRSLDSWDNSRDGGRR